MKSLNLFSKLFSIVVITTIGSLALAAYSAKKAFDTDPHLIAKLEKQFNIHSRGNSFYFNFSDNDTEDTWQLPIPQKKIRIKSYSGDIAIKTSSLNEVLISASGKLDKDQAPKLLDIKSEQNELVIIEPENAVHDLQIRIEIPSSYQNDVIIESTSGDVSIENLSPSSLIIATVSGEIILDSIKTDSLNVNTISGDTQIQKSAVTTLIGKSVSGGIKVDNKGTATTQLKSISGDIVLKLPETENFQFDLTTTSGEIKNEREQNNKASATVEVSTTSGDIKIE